MDFCERNAHTRRLASVGLAQAHPNYRIHLALHTIQYIYKTLLSSYIVTHNKLIEALIYHISTVYHIQLLCKTTIKLLEIYCKHCRIIKLTLQIHV